ncbi:hypothetical protein, partial [Pseudarthrobacter oxydans]|uniref:hypothetical protein n=1 Tax=Pseudarthrobacter oxydans TaxID=1671 RepID=UPI00344C8C06
QLQIGYSLEKCRQDGGMTLIPGIHFPTNREEPVSLKHIQGTFGETGNMDCFYYSAPWDGYEPSPVIASELIYFVQIEQFLSFGKYCVFSEICLTKN